VPLWACPVPTESVESHDQPDRFPVSNPGFVIVFVAASADMATATDTPSAVMVAKSAAPSRARRRGLRIEKLLPADT
jgi:hypothetical protein